MKANRVFLAFFAVCCVLMVQFGCQPQREVRGPAETGESIQKTEKIIQPSEIDAAESGAVISFEKTVYNFGKITPGSNDNLWQFKFKNTGSSPLKITNVESRCKCTPYALEKKIYAPGEEGVLKGEYHAPSKKSSVSQSVYVFSNDKNKPKIKLSIRGKIVPKVECKPETIKLSLAVENAGCPKIVLNSSDNKEFAVSSFTSTNRNCITADFDPDAQAKQFVLQPKVDVEKLRAKMRGSIEIKLTHPECGSVSIPYETIAEYSISPVSVVVLNGMAGVPVKKAILIENNYKKEFDIASASSKNGYVKVLSQGKPANRCKIELEITPPESVNRELYFRDIFYISVKEVGTDDKGGSTKLSIPIMGYYAKDAYK